MERHISGQTQNRNDSALEIDEINVSPQTVQIHDQLRQARLRQARNFAWALLYLAPALILFALFSYFPFFQAIWLSLHVTDEVGNPVRFVGLRYYLSIFNLDGSGNTTYLQSLLTSCRFALMVVVLQIVLGIGLALLAQARVKGIGIFRVIFTVSIAVSLASAGVFWSLLYNPSTAFMSWLSNALHLAQPGVLNNASTALPAMAIMTVWSGLGFNFVITFAGIQAIPVELHESAALDGAGTWKIFRHITLPLLTPILLFLLVVNTIQSFQAFTQFNVLMGGPGPDDATNVFIYQTFLSFWMDHRDGFASAMSIVLFLILLLLSALQLGFLGRRVNYQ
ncbi:carbohydrate ABC transporter permease [Dictyobacter formicarum]|uniref:Glycerol-3-phosphate ABC transporter permease n=1 Tax=Dictyobacter formicarum TaxID=2778368 RepID=A0ABQ3VQV6_9CHLR|nr:sugar ABC transporter permease [Dictyobacter formicarum]GHO88649.1 glycerol-3-phosphate ABC transporter permease [Dictyobacter formicarum]